MPFIITTMTFCGQSGLVGVLAGLRQLLLSKPTRRLTLTALKRMSWLRHGHHQHQWSRHLDINLHHRHEWHGDRAGWHQCILRPGPKYDRSICGSVDIFFGTSAGATGGFGQFTDISKIAVTNVGGLNENDDFTSETNLDLTVWDPSFSRDAGSVILVSSAPSYWANWNIPDDGFGLETKAGLTGGTNVWFSPNYYGSGTGSTNSTPILMGTTLKWTLVPSGCLPTVDGTVGGTRSPNAFFRLSSPPPSQ